METVKIRPGYIVGNYVLEEMVGAGGFSTVYKARSIDPQPEYDTIIAVKVLHPRRLERSQIRRFIKEARIATKLRHENIIRVYELRKQDGNFFILMEFMDGDLLKFIRTKRHLFTQDNINEILLKAAKGLFYIHQNKIIHKDVNPSNILVNLPLEKVKITDFGLSRKNTILMREEKEGGTLYYVAPEILKGKKATVRSDILSFGKTIEKIYQELGFPLPQKIKYILDIATRDIPEERFASMEEIVNLLEHENEVN